MAFSFSFSNRIFLYGNAPGAESCERLWLLPREAPLVR